jgi:hypothetical protein
MMSSEDLEVIYRRYRTLPNGTVLDARKYGLKAWRMVVERKRTK